MVPRSRTARGLAAVTPTAPPLAPANAAAAAADPVEAPTAASNFGLAMGVLHAEGCAEIQKVCRYMHVITCVTFLRRFC